ncbi:hypothetical protein GCG54_00005047 [Colletotrichum gloeosporioides]|uniref:T6SS Phospholipase effector Tle1-like catalytic domain-containing protein n=1 Tax=Colletotrichum gloeosporioides TaxID=474922 RepID=A0A8H4FKQ6_COLGL|nr:uncharacterized protein GCG54_00005047 [Colletotrichum gloeosporioides]KAF3805685.1 hypothetical protein GCG54_00005047 [Colletotrichum gloeosporioides]
MSFATGTDPYGLWESFVEPTPVQATTSASVPADYGSYYTEEACSVAEPAVYSYQTATHDAESAPVRILPTVPPKRIVICCDGTWQSSTTGEKNIPSNVTRLARSISRTGESPDGRIFQQLVYYSSGIGTGDLSFLEKERQGGFGVGLSGDVVEAYNFIVNNYAPEDEIFCFGFSRGAYTARSVAGLITDIGIIQPHEMQDFPELYSLYRKHNDSNNFRQSPEYRRWITGVPAKDGDSWKYEFRNARWDVLPHKIPAERTRVVQVVGVFDTEYPTGGSNYFDNLRLSWALTMGGFHNPCLSPFIKHAFHAMAIDEHRKPFSPTLWHRSPQNQNDLQEPDQSIVDLREGFITILENGGDETKKSKAWEDFIARTMYDELQGSNSELVQVWFPGVHINVGGGNPNILTGDESDFERKFQVSSKEIGLTNVKLALISFAWMCDQIKPYLQLNDDEVYNTLSTLADREVEQRKRMIQDLRTTKPFWKVLDCTGVYKASKKGVPEDGWALGTIVDSFTGMMKMSGSKYRTPGRYKDDNASKDMSETKEEIHPSVFLRHETLSAYRPYSLTGFERFEKSSKKGSPNKVMRGWRNGNLAIPEYVIKPTDTVSRRLAECFAGGREFVAKLDATGDEAYGYN